MIRKILSLCEDIKLSAMEPIPKVRKTDKKTN